MPNQLSSFKRRQSLAEHEAVLAALAVVARRERTSVMALLREAAREAVRSRTEDPVLARELRAEVSKFAPSAPARFKSPAKLARFKRAQREFDRTLLDLNLASAAAIQERNSVATAGAPAELIDFAGAHASPSARS